MGGINFGWLAVWVLSPDWLSRKGDFWMTRFENFGVFIWEKVWLENSLSQTFSRINTPTFSIQLSSIPIRLRRWNRQSVSKRRHIKLEHESFHSDGRACVPWTTCIRLTDHWLSVNHSLGTYPINKIRPRGYAKNSK